MSVQRSEVYQHLDHILTEEGRLLAELEQLLQQETQSLQSDDLEAIRRIGGEPALAHEKDKARDEKDKAWGQRTYGPVSGEGLTSGSVDLF